MHTEALVLSRKRIQILLEQDILLRDIGKDQVHLSAVTSLAAADDRLYHLQHGGNTRATGNHTKVPHHVGRVREGALGSAHTDGLPHGQRGEVLANVACGVGLDEQVEEARLLVAADGRVAADDFLVRAIGLVEHGADGDVLADGETEDVGLAGKGEAVAVDEEEERELDICWALGAGKRGGIVVEAYMAVL